MTESGWKIMDRSKSFYNQITCGLLVVLFSIGTNIRFVHGEEDFRRTVSPVSMETPTVMCDKITTPPRIDGKLDDSCWKKSTRLSSFSLTSGAGLAVEPTAAYVCYDNTNLYIAFECFESALNPMENRLHEFKASEKRRDGQIFHDDCVEIFLDTNRDYSTYVHLAVNALGTVYDAREGSDGIRWNADVNVSTAVGETSWIVEIAIPFQQLNRPAPKAGEIWGLNVCREEMPRKEYSSWAGVKKNFHKPDQFGNVIFGNNVPVAVRNFPVPRFISGGNELSVLLKNTSQKNQVVSFSAEIIPEKGDKRIDATRVELTPNQEKTVTLKYRLDTRGKTKIRFTLFNLQTKELYYSSFHSENIASYTAAVKTASTNPYTLFLNGKKVGEYSGGTTMNQPIWALQQGRNTIAVKCRRGGIIPSLLADITMEGQEDHIVSDTSWKCSTNPLKEAETANLLLNPGFEESHGDVAQPKSWSKPLFSSNLTREDLKAERTTEENHSGNASCKITGMDTVGIKQYGYIKSSLIRFSSPYPTRLHLKGWVKAATSGYTYLYAWVWTADGKKHYLSGKKLKKTDGWEEQSLLLECGGKEITKLQVLVIANGEGTVYWDDFVLVNPSPQTNTNWTQVAYNDTSWPNAGTVNTPEALKWKKALGEFENSHCIWSADSDSNEDMYFRRTLVVRGSSHFDGIEPGETLYFNNESAQQVSILNDSPFLAEYDWILEIPKGFSIIPPGGFTLKQAEAVVRNGQEYQQYTIPVRNASPKRFTAVFEANTNLQDTSFYYYCQAQQGNITELKNKIQVNVLPPLTGRRPKHIVLRMWYAWRPTAFWLPKLNEKEIKAIIRTGRKAGFNSAGGIPIDHPYYDENGRITIIGKQVDCLRQEGFAVIGDWSTCGTGRRRTGGWLLSSLYRKNHPESKGINFEGKEIVCPSFMIEEGYNEFGKSIEKRIRNYGYSGMLWDLELRPYDPYFACCCSKCLDSFRKFAKLDPDILLTPETIQEKYPSPWVDFRCRQNAQLARRMQDMVHKADTKAQYEIYSGYHSEHTRNKYTVDWKVLGKYCDIVSCGYGMPRDLIHETRKVSQKSLIPGIRVIRGTLHTHYLLKLLVESGGTGVFAFQSNDMGAREYQEAAKASNIIADFEDMFLDGKKNNKLIVTITKGVDMLVLEKGTERLLLLFNNSSNIKPIALENAKAENEMTALDYNEKKIIRDPGRMNITISANDVKVIFIGPEEVVTVKLKEILRTSKNTGKAACFLE